MSDTPRTDAHTGKMYSLRQQNDLVPGDFARQLERELTEAQAKLLEQKQAADAAEGACLLHQAREQQLREALQTTLEVLKSNGWDWKAPSVEMAESALSLPPPPVVAMEDAMTTDTASTHAQRQSNFIP